MIVYQGEKFKEYLSKHGISATSIAEKLGISRQAIYKYFKTANLEASTVYNIVDKLGVTEDDIWKETPKLEAKPIRLADPEGFEATGDRFYTLPDQTIIMQTPVIPVKAYGSYLRGHADPEFYEGLETMPVPVDIKHKGTYLIFEVEGESMVNFTTAEFARKSIWPGQRVIGRDLRRDHWKYKLHINSTECWIIVHRERGIVIKSIIEHDVDNAQITLHSWNPDKNEHPDYTVSLDDVDQIFNVVDPFKKIR
jgi:transcriptional regulator with XRE-family HTH domain